MSAFAALEVLALQPVKTPVISVNAITAHAIFLINLFIFKFSFLNVSAIYTVTLQEMLQTNSRFSALDRQELLFGLFLILRVAA